MLDRIPIDPMIGDPAQLELSTDTDVAGPLLGAGRALVTGHGR